MSIRCKNWQTKMKLFWKGKIKMFETYDDILNIEELAEALK